VTVVVGGGTVVAVDGPRTGSVVLEGDRVSAVVGGDRPFDVDARGGWVVPGFIDVQINGAGGIDVTTEPERISELGSLLARDGVTAFLPTVVTCEPALRAGALSAWAERVPGDGAVPFGLHLEGPMLAPVRRGAHPEAFLVAPAADLVADWTPEAGVTIVTLAPELPGALDLVRTLVGRGVRVSIGHTDCSAEEFAAARGAGASYVTHLFNAMRPFTHRDPGPVGAALADDGVVVGLICDGVHVDPIAVRMAWHALGPHRLNLVTDAVAARGAAGGRLGSVDVEVGAGSVRTPDGVLAGSLLTLDAAVRNLVAFTGCAVPEAVATVTSTPADMLGLVDRGRLQAGARADVTVLDRELRVLATIVGGEVAWRS
jgi:N-acetylglucosamine-6-phosphate deacetylase